MHLRPMGSSQKGIWTGRVRSGYGQYFMGTAPLYLFLASAVFRLPKHPVLLGSIAMLWGYASSAARGVARYDGPEFRRFLDGTSMPDVCFTGSARRPEGRRSSGKPSGMQRYAGTMAGSLVSRSRDRVEGSSAANSMSAHPIHDRTRCLVMVRRASVAHTVVTIDAALLRMTERR